MVSQLAFFNFPLVYFMLINLDLNISALLTTRNYDGHMDDSWTLGSAEASRYISLVLAWLYLIGFAAVMVVLIVAVCRAENARSISSRIGVIKFGARLHSKRPVLVFVSWFFVMRVLMALIVSVTGVIPEVVSCALFLTLMTTSFVVAVVNRLFKSWFLYLAMCVMELFLVFLVCRHWWSHR